MQKEIKLYEFEQRSPEWYKIREAKITASPIINILGKLTTQKCLDAIDNLALKLAIESKIGCIENDFVSFDMQRGIDLEPSALNKLADILSLEFIEVSKVGFAEYNEHVGASPDGLCSNNHCIEIKCPTIDKVFKMTLKDEIEDKYIAQMQMQMMCTDTDYCYFFAYAVHMGNEYYFKKIIQRDEAMIDLIKERCELVIAKKLDYIQRLNKNIIL